MASSTNPSYPPFGEVSGPPSAPPCDGMYPQLPNDTKDPYQGPPPSYSEIAPQPPPNGQPQPLPTPLANPQPLPTQSVVGSPNTPANQAVVAPTPTVIASANHPQPVQVVLQGGVAAPLPPGVCHLCRKGKIKDSATCCSWVACCFLLPFGIIPGLIAFCYACRKPKCSRCGFIHGK